MIKIENSIITCGCSHSHIEHCYLSGGVKSRHYYYYGKRVFRGTLVLELKNGLYFLYFEERNNNFTLTFLNVIK